MNTIGEQLGLGAQSLRAKGDDTSVAIAHLLEGIAEWQEIVETRGRDHAAMGFSLTVNRALTVAFAQQREGR